MGERIVPGQTLIILDEIQTCDRALTSLKYFCEETPEYHIVAAGCLMGVAINPERYSFPVGKVETITLYPFDFEEYLWVRGEAFLCDEIRRCYIETKPLSEALHQKATALYREYFIIGGMPACINIFNASGSYDDVQRVQKEILNNYFSFLKDSIFDSIPAQFTGGLDTAIEQLIQTKMVLKSQKISKAVEPISVYVDLSSYKLYIGDVGMLTMKSGVPWQAILAGEENMFISENYLAQQLVAKDYHLFHLENGQANFVLQKANDVILLEVEKGQLTLKLIKEKEDLKSIPLYAAFCI